jgi:hypothetical protein
MVMVGGGWIGGGRGHALCVSPWGRRKKLEAFGGIRMEKGCRPLPRLSDFESEERLKEKNFKVSNKSV